MSNPRRPIAAVRSHALPTLLALAAVSATAGCIGEAHAQPVPAPDAGVSPHPQPNPQPHPQPRPPVPVPGGIGMVGPMHRPAKIH